MTSALVSSRISTVRATVELIRWSLIRNAINAPLFAVVQALFAFALLYGISVFCRILTGICRISGIRHGNGNPRFLWGV